MWSLQSNQNFLDYPLRLRQGFFESLIRGKRLFTSIYKPSSQNIQDFLGALSYLLDFFQSKYYNEVTLEDFNLEPTNPIMLGFLSDLILTKQSLHDIFS